MPPTSSAPETPLVFLWFHRDATLDEEADPALNILNALKGHLQPLVSQGHLKTWDVTEIQAGSLVKRERDAALASARIAVFLVSSGLLTDNTADALVGQLVSRGIPIACLHLEHTTVDTKKYAVKRRGELGASEFMLTDTKGFNHPDRPLVGLTRADQNETLTRAAKTIAELVRQTKPTTPPHARLPREAPPPAPGPPEPDWSSEPPRPPKATSTESFTHTSVVLNRILQWGTLKDQCGPGNQDHTVFLAHGSTEQDVALFVKRITSFLNRDCKWWHSFVTVKRSGDHSTARSATEWEGCLVAATKAGTGQLEHDLCHEAEKHPVLILFTDDGGPLRYLDGPSADGLANLLVPRLDSILEGLQNTGKIKNPIRIVIPLEHPSSGSGEDPAVHRLVMALKDAKPLKFIRLPELRFPPWFEVERHIKEEHPKVSPATLEACKEIHRKIQGAPGRTLQRLGDELHRALHRPTPPTPKT